MTQPVSELDALRWLKESAHQEVGPSPEVEQRLIQRLSLGIAAAAIGGVGVATSLGTEAAPGGPINLRIFGSRLALWSAPALLVGAIAGVEGHAALARKPSPSTYVEKPAVPKPPETTAASVESLPLVVDSSSPKDPQPRPQASKPTSSPAVGAGAAGTLAKERSVLDPARAALAAGDPGRALKLADAHSHEFPRGVLSEEREAIAIHALVSMGRFEQANSRAARFRKQYPNSLMTHFVEAAIAAVPN